MLKLKSKLNSIKKKITDTTTLHPKATTVGATLAIGAGIMVAADFAHLGMQMAFGANGQCGTCATSVTPHSLSSSLSDTGAHGAEKVFSPGHEALSTGGSASDFSPGHEKP